VTGSSTPQYGNWVSRRLVYAPAGLGLALTALGFLWFPFAIPGVALLFVAGYFTYARYLFSPGGGDVQGAIWTFLLDHLDWDGRGDALDIGCGSGALSIRLAKKFSDAEVVGIDSWGGNWEYSKALCERNALIEGVGDRLTFQKASAASLPFPDESFDVVVSNLVFHEVKEVSEKQSLVREALRVLKSGGRFAIQDLFLFKQVYGDMDVLLGAIRGWGITKVEFVETRRETFLPQALKLPFMVGTLGMIVGVK